MARKQPVQDNPLIKVEKVFDYKAYQASAQRAADEYCRSHGLDTVQKKQAHIRQVLAKMPTWKRPALLIPRIPGEDDE